MRPHARNINRNWNTFMPNTINLNSAQSMRADLQNGQAIINEALEEFEDTYTEETIPPVTGFGNGDIDQGSVWQPHSILETIDGSLSEAGQERAESLRSAIALLQVSDAYLDKYASDTRQIGWGLQQFENSAAQSHAIINYPYSSDNPSGEVSRYISQFNSRIEALQP
jgi:hypothetical protein